MSTSDAAEAVTKTSHYNFNAGPALLPDWVKQKAAEELAGPHADGMSILEVSHRSKRFMDVVADTKARFRAMLNVPENYEILFLQGGARLQFSMIPMNLQVKGKPANYAHTGSWTAMAFDEAKKQTDAQLVATSEKENFNHIPEIPADKLAEDAAYLYLCANNTIFGTQYKNFPETKAPLIADMTSELLSRPLPVEKFGLFYASAQKNLGVAGLTVVVIRKDLAERASENLPVMLQYRNHIKADSLLNTPPGFGIFVLNLMLKWMENEGGLLKIQAANEKKAAKLYQAIDESDFYSSPVVKKDRSTMNVVFTLAKKYEALSSEWLEGAEAAGLHGLKGHRSVGGYRASLYNAQPEAAVDSLIKYMKEFEAKKA